MWLIFFLINQIVGVFNIYIILFLLFVAKIDDSERLRPEELNQQNIEALVAENNLVWSIPSSYFFPLYLYPSLIYLV